VLDFYVFQEKIIKKLVIIIFFLKKLKRLLTIRYLIVLLDTTHWLYRSFPLFCMTQSNPHKKNRQTLNSPPRAVFFFYRELKNLIHAIPKFMIIFLLYILSSKIIFTSLVL